MIFIIKLKYFSAFAFVFGLLSVFSMFSFKAKGNSEKNENVPFEFKLFSLVNKNNNFMISPISVEMVFMMLANSNVTEDAKNEILNAWGVDNFEAYQKWAFDFLLRMKEKKIVDINNSVWLNTDSGIALDAFNGRPFDFFTERFLVNRFNAKNNINSWISEKTKGKIQGIDIDGDFSAVLLNATYFKKAWESPFGKYRTHDASFNNIDGSITKTAFMSQDGDYNFYENEDFRMAEIPYEGKESSMYVFVPKQGNIDSFDYKWLDEGIRNKSEAYITLSLPKFSVKTDLCLNKALKALGIESIFKPSSMYSGHSISDVLHKTYIDVNEEGTEATAITAAIAKCCLAPSFVVNKPFVYVIRENTSGKILFMGSQCKF